MVACDLTNYLTMRLWFFFLKGKKKEKELPESMEMISDSMRKTNGVLYFEVCRDFLPCVVGKIAWKNKLFEKNSLQEIATSSDEAFMLLVLENNWDEWITDDSGGTVSGSARKGKRKYTASAGSCYNRGWDSEGKLRFRELRMLVDGCRQQDPSWDVWCLGELRKAVKTSAGK